MTAYSGQAGHPFRLKPEWMARLAGIRSLDLAMGFVRRTLPLHRGDLGLGQHDAFLGHFSFQCLEPKLTALQRVTNPNAAD